MTSGTKVRIALVAALSAAGPLAVLTAQNQPKPVVKVVANSATPADRQRATPAPNPGTTAPAASKPAEVLIARETYAYPGAVRRDPFVSLMNTEELRPLIGDLKLVAIAFDPTGRNSVAVLRDVTTKEQYRVKVGQSIGRMRVASISEKRVLFGIEEFGYSRQESLAMTDSTKARTQ